MTLTQPPDHVKSYIRNKVKIQMLISYNKTYEKIKPRPGRCQHGPILH